MAEFVSKMSECLEAELTVLAKNLLKVMCGARADAPQG